MTPRRRAARATGKYAWKTTKWLARNGWKHRVPLAPIYIATGMYGTATAEHYIAITQQAQPVAGTVTLAATGIAGLAAYRWRGLPTRTRLAELDTRERAITLGTWGATGIAGVLGTLTANLGPGVPMPGIWALTTLAAGAGWWTALATDSADTPARASERARAIWSRRVAPTKGPIPGSTLTRIERVDGHSLTPEDHLGPIMDRAGWRGTVELAELGPATSTLLTKQDIRARVAAAYKTTALHVITGYAPDHTEDRMQVTILTKTATGTAITYSPDEWQVQRNGAVPVAVTADGEVPQMRVWEPGSGAAHTFIAGTTGSGKSRATELIITQAAATGHVVPVICDPQRGASLPAWGGLSGVAPVIARNTEEISAVWKALDAVAAERGDLLASTGTSGWDVPTMLEKHARPMILIVLDEAHVALQDKSEFGELMRALAAQAAKTWRKVGMGIMLITQTPNLEEIGGQQAIRDNLTSANRISLRTGSQFSGGMILPPTAPDPYAIPQMINNQPTHGMAAIATAAPFGLPTGYARFPYLSDDLARSEALRLAQDVVPDLDPAAAERLGVDVAAWRDRLGRIADGTAEPATPGVSVLADRERSSKIARILDYVRAQNGATVLNAQIVGALGYSAQTVATSLARLADEGHVKKIETGKWQAV